MSVVLTPAFGRDYRSVAEIKADLLADKDFVANSYDGSSGYINRPQLLEMGLRSVNVRYKSLRSVAVVDLAKLAPKGPSKPRAAAVTTDQIVALRSEAMTAGDTDTVVQCNVALRPTGARGRAAARKLVAEVIREASDRSVKA